jgi:hypothetical protein
MFAPAVLRPTCELRSTGALREIDLDCVLVPIGLAGGGTTAALSALDYLIRSRVEDPTAA